MLLSPRWQRGRQADPPADKDYSDPGSVNDHPVDLVEAGYDYYSSLATSVENCIRKIGKRVWDTISPLNYKDFVSVMNNPLSWFNPESEELKVLAAGMELVFNAVGSNTGKTILQMVDITPESLLEQTPIDLIDSLVHYELLIFRKEPPEVADLSLIWMNVGFAPW